MELHDVVEGLPTLGLRGDPATSVTDVTHDSRRVTFGTLFCCVTGDRSDGHDFASDAARSGATALLVERWLDVDLPQVLVERVRSVMGVVAARVHGDPSHALTVVGITGTNGKTTTAYLMEALATAAGRLPAVVGTIETRIAGETQPGALTTPEATDLQSLFATMRDRHVELVAMEVSSHALTFGRLDGTTFAAGVFTNLSHDHLDFHGDIESYFEAKALLFQPGRIGVAVVNGDDSFGARLVVRTREAGIPTVTFSPTAMGGDPPDVWVQDVMPRRTGTDLTLRAPAWELEARLTTPLLGRFNAANVAAAAAAGLAIGLDPDVIVSGLQGPVRVPGRFEPVERDQAFTLLVDYAHTPDALDRALASARELAGEGRVLVVFGCGGDRDRDKRPLMGAAAARGADVAIVTSDNPRGEDPDAIIHAIVEGMTEGARPIVEADRRRAIFRAVGEARPGDVVIVAGKGHETGQTVGERVLPFDDRAVAAQAIEERPCA